jgi:FtsP/CotA-like multicopper oxidase with cupredoxin domain
LHSDYDTVKLSSGLSFGRLRMNERDNNESIRLSRRVLLKRGAAGLLGSRLVSSAVTQAGQSSVETRKTTEATYVPRPHPSQYHFRVGATALSLDGRSVPGIAVNGQYPGPEIRLREGSMLRVEVENELLDEPTSIHWHGLLLPASMDGVPDVSIFPIAPKRVFVYEYPLLQSGTYWYHSHWRLQEQIGMAGPFVIEAGNEPLRVDHDVVIFLGDWLHQSPYSALEALKKNPRPMATAARMADTKPDLADIQYDAFLLNGRASLDPWTYRARPGERIRLRIVNAAASTYFRLHLDGHPLTITHADGLAVEPVEVDHLLMGMAEVYDAIVTLSGSGSYTLHAAAIDGSGQAIGILHTPDTTAKPNLAIPTFRGRALSYSDLRAPAPTVLPPGAVRSFTLALQGNMAKYVWTINGQAYPKSDPLVISQGDRVQVELRNETSMWHPMHLHGHFFRILQGAGERAPLKHTVSVAPRESVRIEFTADNPGRWFFHCHNLYHLEAGMARIFEYEA